MNSSPVRLSTHTEEMYLRYLILVMIRSLQYKNNFFFLLLQSIKLTSPGNIVFFSFILLEQARND